MDWAHPKVRRCTIPRITFPVLLFKWSLLFVLISGAIKMGTTEWRNTRQSKGRDWSTKAIGSGGSSEISGAASRATLIPKERSRSRTQCTMLPKCTIMMKRMCSYIPIKDEECTQQLKCFCIPWTFFAYKVYVHLKESSGKITLIEWTSLNTHLITETNWIANKWTHWDSQN